MISHSQLEYFKNVGIWYTGVKALDHSHHVSSLKSFLNKSEAYKSNFLQTKFNSGFEGYSYMGQTDSANQYADDQLYTYVISDYFDANLHPPEFNPLISSQKGILPQIKTLERELLSALSQEALSFYDTYISHSLSANYYPPKGANSLRLSPHPDGSLLTVFPFGMDEQFKFEAPDGSWHTIEKTNEIVCFSGYLLQCHSGIKALHHKVEESGTLEERFSFAYFSVPKPKCSFHLSEGETTTEAYFKKYLSLFD